MDADVNHHKCNSKRYTKWDHMWIEDKNSKKKNKNWQRHNLPRTCQDVVRIDLSYICLQKLSVISTLLAKHISLRKQSNIYMSLKLIMQKWNEYLLHPHGVEMHYLVFSILSSPFINHMCYLPPLAPSLSLSPTFCTTRVFHQNGESLPNTIKLC